MSKNKDQKNAAAKGNAGLETPTEPKISKVEQLNQDKLDLTLHLQRLQAEFENFQKRNAANSQRFVKLANKELIKKLLPILDNFQLAFQNKESKEFIKGMELIYSSFSLILEENGLKKINTEGKFNPYKHEVLLTEESEEEPETILQELQSGFALNGEVIRSAKVKVSK
jgi:molecular chaperone GrpE